MTKLQIITIITLLTLSSSKFLVENSESPSSDIFEGILTGLTKGTNYKCKTDLLKGGSKITNIINELIEEIKSGKDIVTSVTSAISKLSSVSGLLTHCRLLNIVSSCSSIITENGRKKIVERIYNNQKHLINDMNALIESVSKKDYINAGKVIGDGIKIVFDFYVN